MTRLAVFVQKMQEQTEPMGNAGLNLGLNESFGRRSSVLLGPLIRFKGPFSPP